ncbi:MAG: hypothetical protein ACYS1E_01790 [Planctomycetota bacterium]
MGASAGTVHEARCPRCGYDLRGSMAAWRDTCPLDGTCTECGLFFEWRELLSPQFAVPLWCVEALRPLRWLPRQVVGTLVRSFWPWRFWSLLRMIHPSHWPRVAVYLGLIAAALYVAFALAHGLATWQAWHEDASLGNMIPSTGGAAVFWQAAALPLADSAVGSFTSPFGTWPYQTPWEAFRYLWYHACLVVLLVLAMHACCGLSFAALPFTRRRCKVRWSHLVRVTLYGYVLGVPALLLSLAAMPMAVAEMRAGALVEPLAAVAWGALPFMAVAWWAAATSRYLRMPHAWGVGLAVVVIGILTPPAVLAVIGYALSRL